MFIMNAFPLGALKAKHAWIEVKELGLEEARQLVAKHQFKSAVGHADTAKLFSDQLGIPVEFNRVTLTDLPGCCLVGQYSGPRLPEGATVLPEGASIRWLLVYVEREGDSEYELIWAALRTR